MPRLVLLCLALCLSAPVFGQVMSGPTPRIDRDTGRSLAHWPHDRHFDHLHMRLELDLESLDPPVIRGREVLRMKAVGQDRGQIHLDAVGLEIESVDVRWTSDARDRLRPGRAVGYTYDGQDLVISLSKPAGVGEPIEVILEYRITRFEPRGEGLTIEPGQPDADSDSLRFPVIFSQGEAESNSQWFACHDFPNERLSTELIVTVDEPFQVVSNGRLVEVRPLGHGRTRWHWLQQAPHVNYLVQLVIGVFERVDLGGPDSARPDLPMSVWTLQGTGERVRQGFAETPAMLAYFEELFDEPYPWDKYDQVITRGYVFGAMENTSASTFYPQAAFQSADELRDVVAHELAHQWFGNLVTCKSWAHLWLNEGFATYAEALWAEERAGDDPKARRDAYLRAVSHWYSGQASGNRAVWPEYPALVSNHYGHPDHTFGKIDNPYSKGALVLHMLRMGLGDEVFFAGVRLYLDRFRFRSAETDDLRRALEDVSGRSLEQFFAQWCKRAGVAQLDVAFEVNGEELSVDLTQTQRIDALNPPYRFLLPIYVRYAEGTGEYVYIEVNEQHERASFSLRSEPIDAAIDPNMTVLAAFHITRPIGHD